MKIRDASGWTMFIFGAGTFLLGLIGLIRPETILWLLGFDVVQRGARTAGDYSVVFIMAASAAYSNLGIYYLLAALNDLKIFYKWSVPFRMLTFLLYSSMTIARIAPLQFIAVGIWELIGALSTLVSRRFEKNSRPEPNRKVNPRKSKKAGTKARTGNRS